MVEGNTAAELRRWCAEQDPAWLAGIGTVATDLAESYRAALWPHLTHAERVADPFHVVRVANRCVDKGRRVQNETLGHRGCKPDPLYRIRKLLLAGTERPGRAGQRAVAAGPSQRRSARRGARCMAGQSIGEGRVSDRRSGGGSHPRDKAIAGCAADNVEEIRSLGNTLSSWRNEIVAHHRTGASDGPTEDAHSCLTVDSRVSSVFVPALHVSELLAVLYPFFRIGREPSRRD